MIFLDGNCVQSFVFNICEQDSFAKKTTLKHATKRSNTLLTDTTQNE